jgi:DNA topoisomerase-2
VGGNSEIQNIMKIMGLNMGRTYTDASSLRYGHIMIMTDQDHDGSHIKGLIINFLHYYWPSLLKIPNFLQVFITPIVKCSKNSQTRVFYTTPEYQAWCATNNPKQWKIKYYKGLGTSSAKEAKEYFSNLAKNRLHFEIIRDGTQIDMCFNKKRVEDRKAWIGNYRHGTHMDFSKKEMSYSDFVDKEYIVMAIESNLRGIPHVMDGLKPSQRKILFACLKRKLHSEIKVAQLAGYTSEHAAYHHGEMSLNNTIVGMAQNFTGSNNIHLLAPNGQFGTRLMGGKDAASPRYIFTQLAETTELIFRPEDTPLYEYLEDDGQSIEPAFYLPIIPMILVNGANGIGTGWSTTIPSYNPKDIIQNLKRMLSNQSLLEMAPWSKGFTGSVRAITDTKYEYEGVWTWKSANTIHISELPVGIWTNNYKEYLEKVQGTSDKILDIKSNHTDTTIAFTVKLSQKHAVMLRNDTEKLKKFFKMTSTKDTGNMHAFEVSGTMKKYNAVQEIMHAFYRERLALYAKRKAYQISSIQNSAAKINEKIKFLKAVVSGMFSFKGKRKPELVQMLASWPFEPQNGSFDYLLNMPMWNMTLDKIQELEYKLRDLTDTLTKLSCTSIQQIWNLDLQELEAALYPSKKRILHQFQVSNKKQKVGNK